MSTTPQWKTLKGFLVISPKLCPLNTSERYNDDILFVMLREFQLSVEVYVELVCPCKTAASHNFDVNYHAVIGLGNRVHCNP